MSQQALIAAQLRAANYTSQARALAQEFGPEQINKIGCTRYEQDYLKLISKILAKGVVKSSRTGSLTLSLAAQQLDISLQDIPYYVPLLHTKQVFHETFLKENRWFFSGSTDIEGLKKDGVSIWDSWVTPESARFAFDADKPDVQDMLGRDFESYVRCKIQGAWPILVQYKRERQIGTLNKEQAAAFRAWFSTYTNNDLPIHTLNELKHQMRMVANHRLVGGDIGSGAYGASWRAVKDTRFLDHLDSDKIDAFLARGFEQENLGMEADAYVFTRTVDQLAQVIEGLKKDPNGRRHIMSAWNIPLIDETVLPACHSFVQFISQPNDTGKPGLVCMLHQRSSDSLVGAPFNVGQYACLTHMIAEATGHVAERLVMNMGDAHIYFSQIPFIQQQIDNAQSLRREIHIGQRHSLGHLEGIKGITLDDFAKVLPTIVDYGGYMPSVPYPVEV